MSRFALSCENYNFCQKLENRRVDVNLSKRAPTRSAISTKTAIIVKSVENWKKCRVDVNLLKRALTRSVISVKTAKIAIIVKSAKNWKNR